MIPGQLTDPGVNFTSVHGLTPVTVHMSFSLLESLRFHNEDEDGNV